MMKTFMPQKSILSLLTCLAVMVSCAMLLFMLPGTVLARTEYMSGDYSYTFSAEGEVTVTGYHGDATVVVIPSRIDGLPVTVVGQDAFYKEDCLRGIVIPEGVVRIEEGAFTANPDLISVTLPSTVTEIGEEAFYDCGFEHIVLPEGLERLGDFAFEDCVNLVSISLPEGITGIGEGVFMGCKALAQVSFSDEVESIGDFAFFGCAALKDLAFPQGLTHIGMGAFAGCEGFGHIELPPKLGVIGDYAFTRCKGLRSVSFLSAETAVEIGTGAFADCEALRGLALPVTGEQVVIENLAFSGCENLRFVDIPSGVTDIQENVFLGSGLQVVGLPGTLILLEDAFAGCNDLTDIYYEGNRDEWEKLCARTWLNLPGRVTVHVEEKMPDEPDVGEIEDFVERLYENFLGREADARGLAAWSNALFDGEATGAEVVYSFVYSREFQNNPLSNEAFVTAMYETIFERKPDAKGLAAWVSVLDNGCTRKKVLSGFLNSREMQNLCDELQITQGSYLSDEIVDENPSVTAFVMRLYRCCFDRDGDKKGLAAWTGALLEGRATGAQVAEGFFLSREMANRELSDEQFVIYAYLALLDRQPDARGLAAWTGVLEDGRPRRDIVAGFAQSREFTALCEKYGIERG